VDERWVTVQELRTRFGLTRYQCNTVSGFLRRLAFGPFGQFPYIVASITREVGSNPSDPRKCRYLLKLLRQEGDLPVIWRLFMARNGNVPELLERFMEESGETERWVTVNEFRTRFDLDESASPAISGFLRCIHQDPFFTFPWRVERIEKVAIFKPHADLSSDTSLPEDLRRSRDIQRPESVQPAREFVMF